jgi:hypothetical protein
MKLDNVAAGMWRHPDEIRPERGIVRLGALVMRPGRDEGDHPEGEDDGQTDSPANDF